METGSRTMLTKTPKKTIDDFRVVVHPGGLGASEKEGIWPVLPRKNVAPFTLSGILVLRAQTKGLFWRVREMALTPLHHR